MAKTKVFRKKTLKKSTKKRKMSIKSKYGKKKNKTIKNKGGKPSDFTIESITYPFRKLKDSFKAGYKSILAQHPSKATISTDHLKNRKL
jgi:hypothetical protein